MSVIDEISKLWSDFLGFLSTIIIPDWSGLIALLPVFVLIGIVGPLLTLAVLGWLGFEVTKPRTQVRYDEGTKVAPLDYLGQPIFPAGEPHCPTDGLIYPSGTVRCERDGTPLSVRCPKCALTREAAIDTCGNCGLILKIAPRAMIVATDRPPPGGAAVA